MLLNTSNWSLLVGIQALYGATISILTVCFRSDTEFFDFQLSGANLNEGSLSDPDS